MARYAEWNRAIVERAVAGARLGENVYLSVNDEALEQIGRAVFGSTHHESWAQDFRQAMRDKVVIGERLELDQLRGLHESTGYPAGVGFLAATVLAAYKMADAGDDRLLAINYFTRLREVLGVLTDTDGRPKGMKAGSEEPLWLAWIGWLHSHGFFSTAAAGEGPQRFISYPISQAILRQADRDRLGRLLEANRQFFPPQIEAEELLRKLKPHAGSLGKHLRALLTADARVDDIAQALYSAFEDWRDQVPGASAANRGRHLFAGLYRVEDWLSGEPEYLLYPHQPRGWVVGELRAEIGGRALTLRPERPGWYLPEQRLQSADWTDGASYPVLNHPFLETLILPKRGLWALVRDPESPESGAHATWGSPRLGIPFVLLAREDYLSDLKRLRDERLVEWYGDPRPLGDGWFEVLDCMATAQSWPHVVLQHNDLRELLLPRESIEIGVSGGLRVSGYGWLEGFGPELTVFSFSPEATLEITNVDTEATVLDEGQRTGAAVPVPWPGPGNYLATASSAAGSARRLVKLVPWDALSRSSEPPRERLELGDKFVIGAFVEGENL